ncbi:phage minor head protein [Vagococcus sp. PNs007]|uniref:Phage minor head protein n=1 Tax=Vagococcus proximus TaxID=2991417 RepID=A0ABT5X2W9_9ENTE|nr:phage minor head protein [Vagococcus proximus]MDF0480259.1 phage minor head protein [Vagococcus proximus]
MKFQPHIVESVLKVGLEEDEELLKILEKMAPDLAKLILKYIKEMQEGIEIALTTDNAEFIVIAEYIFLNFETVPTADELGLLFSTRQFIDEIDKTFSIIKKVAEKDMAKKLAKLQNVAYQELGGKVSDKLDKWFKDLPDLMNTTTENAVADMVKKTFEKGHGISWLKARLHELPEFSYYRSRVTSITETLRIYSSCSYTSFLNNEEVEGLRWRHTTGIDEPRTSHEMLDGTVISKGELFDVEGEYALYPHDPELSAKQTIHCHCWIEPMLKKEYIQ